MARLGNRLRELILRWVLDLPLERAHQAALRLLKDNLSPERRHQLELLNFFDVVGGDTGSHYRIYFDDRMNIDQIDASGNFMGSYGDFFRH
jgi:hypothetical protein